MGPVLEHTRPRVWGGVRVSPWTDGRKRWQEGKSSKKKLTISNWGGSGGGRNPRTKGEKQTESDERGKKGPGLLSFRH